MPDDPEAVFTLLSWRARLAPLAGREKDKETLLQWARQGRKARIRLLTGPGGAGKSRLAAEVAETLRAEGWTAGFVRPNDPIVVPLRREGLFLIVDYPAERPNEVRKLLREVASRELRDIRVRLLVLSRHGGDRWFDLVESAHAGDLMDAQAIGLSGLAAEPETLFSEALRRLAQHYGRPTPVISSELLSNWIAINPRMHRLPLFLAAAAVHAFSNPEAAIGFNGASIVQALVEREQTRLDNAGHAAGLGMRGASRIFALATVPGAVDASLLRQLANPALEIGLPSPHHVVDAVRSLYVWHADHVAAPEPDIVAAALLVKTLSERPDKAPEWLWLVIKNATPSALIDRLGRVLLDTTILTESPAAITCHLSRMIADDPHRAVRLEFLTVADNLPLSLAGFAADVDRSLASVATGKNTSP